MTNLPKTVQWVLDFLNINNTPGKPDLYRLPFDLRKLNRPPVPRRSPNLELINNRLIDKSTGYQWGIIKKDKKHKRINIFKVKMKLQELQAKEKRLLQRLLPDKKDEEIEKLIKQHKEEIISALNNRDETSEVIKALNLAKDLEFDGINNDPTLEDYKQFFLKKGIPPYKGKDLLLENGKPLSSLNIKSYNNRPKNNNEPGFYDYYQDNPRIEHTFYEAVLDVRWELLKILRNVVHGTKSYGDEREATEVLKGYMKGIKRNKDRFPHYGMLPHALYACILDFGINHKELHQYLRQCLHCGRFEIREKKRGRPEKFCSDVCRERHDDQSREANKEAVKKTREYQKPKKQEEDYKALVKYLKQKGHPEEEAKEIAQGWVYTYGKSFKEYKRTQGAMY